MIIQNLDDRNINWLTSTFSSLSQLNPNNAENATLLDIMYLDMNQQTSAL